MYSIPGIDDEEYLAQILGTTPLDDEQQVFQAQQPQAPALAQLLNANGVTQQMQDMSEGGSDIAEQMAQTAQGFNTGNGSNRMAQQQQANQAAMQQAQQSSGGGLLGSLLKIGANIALNKWIGGMFTPKKGA